MKRWSALAALACAGALSLGTPYAGWAAAGEEIELGSDRPGAPVVEPGLHSLDVDGPGWFQVERTLDDSTIWVGESIVAPTSTVPEYYLSMSNRAGKDCAGAGDGEVGIYLFDHRLRGGVTSSGACDGKGAVWVEHSFGTIPDYGGELATVAIWEEPPAWDDLPGPGLEVPWNGEALPSRGAAELGSSFAEAPTLADGSFAVTLRAGEPALFKVRLDWNQHVQVFLRQSGRTLDGREVVRPRLYNPLGGRVDWGTPVVSPAGPVLPRYDWLALNISEATGGVISPIVRYRNREEGNAAAFAGDYFVSLEVEDSDQAPDGEAEVQVELRIGTNGPVASPYRSTPLPLPDLAAVGGAGDEPEEGGAAGGEEEPRQRDSASSDGDDARPWPAAIGLLAGSVVFGVAGSLLLGRWRRA